MGSMIEAKKRYHNAYQMEHYKTVSVTVNRDKDADVLARLTEHKNVSGYVRELVKKDMDNAPTVDAVKHGRVIDGKCSVCNHKMNAWACDFVYCPYCKAKMDEVIE